MCGKMCIIQRYEQQYEQQYEQERKQIMLTFDSTNLSHVYYELYNIYYNREKLCLNKKLREEVIVHMKKDIDWLLS